MTLPWEVQDAIQKAFDEHVEKAREAGDAEGVTRSLAMRDAYVAIGHALYRWVHEKRGKA